MPDRYDQARRLRKNQTDAERTLWFRLRDRRLRGWKFKRQVPIDRYVVDFLCPDAKLVIELDGGQHGKCVAYDLERTEILESAGYLVLRFWNDVVLSQTDIVLEEIVSTLECIKQMAK